MARMPGPLGARHTRRPMPGALRISLLGLVVVGLLYMLTSPIPPSAPADWSRFGYDPAGGRANPAERQLDAVNVHQLHRLWQTKLTEVADSSPAYLHALRFPDGTTRDVLYLTTKSGILIALDANTGRQLWAHQSPSAGPNMVTTSSPLADPRSGSVYSYALDGKVHRYSAITGAEIVAHGWPETVTTMPHTEKVSSALNAANGFLYVTTASCCGDAPPYQGHVVAIDLAHGTKHVFNAVCADRPHLLMSGECSASGAGIWAGPGVVVDPTTGNIFTATGNGPYTGDRGGHAWGESILELTPDATRLVDTYTPEQPEFLGSQDLDLGSTAPAMLPAILTSKTPYLAVQADKEGVLRLLNRRDLSGHGGPGHTGGALQTIDSPDHCPVLAQPSVWTDPTNGAIWLFVADGCALGGYQAVTSAAGATTLRAVWTIPNGATSPVVAGGVLFAASTDPHHQALFAFDPRSGRQLWSSAAPTANGSIGPIHWESPIVIGGRVYCTDEQSQITAYGLA